MSLDVRLSVLSIRPAQMYHFIMPKPWLHCLLMAYVIFTRLVMALTDMVKAMVKVIPSEGSEKSFFIGFHLLLQFRRNGFGVSVFAIYLGYSTPCRRSSSIFCFSSRSRDYDFANNLEIPQSILSRNSDAIHSEFPYSVNSRS